jgi:hypothetical protein
MLIAQVGRRCGSSGWIFALAAAALVACAWIAPATAADLGTTVTDPAAKTAQPAVTSPAPAAKTAQPTATVVPPRTAAVKGPAHKAAAAHPIARQPVPYVRMAEIPPRPAQECFLFCWRFNPIIHGVAY